MTTGYACDFCGDPIPATHRLWEISVSIPGENGGKTFEACDVCLGVLRAFPVQKNLRTAALLLAANAKPQQQCIATPEAKE